MYAHREGSKYWLVEWYAVGISRMLENVMLAAPSLSEGYEAVAREAGSSAA